MKKENRFVVISGKYEQHYYGATPTLLGAKRLARKNREIWNICGGIYRTPDIYKLCECSQDDKGNYFPTMKASPVAIYSDIGKVWLM